MARRSKIITVLFLITSPLWIWSSCSAGEMEQPAIGAGATEGYMKITFNIPEYKVPADGKTQTRSMSPAGEAAINIDRLSVLVFKSDGKFYYKAPIVANSLSVTPDADNPGRGTGSVITKLVKSADGAETFDFMLVANHDVSGITMTEGQTDKANVIDQLVYSMPPSGKWNTATGSATPFPMWGELTDRSVTENMTAPEITLYRALARIDVGLGFEMVDSKFTETALGLENFKIKEINVYRTYNQGYVASLNSPSAPAGAVKYADDKPLEYAAAVGVDRYVREIYVPETTLPDTPENGNMHNIVVGGYYGGSDKLTYYRLDFAQDTGTRIYKPILRNHRYVFNILSVRGPGLATPEDALASTPLGSIDYDLIVWDESIHEMHVQGKYYFGLDNRELTLQAKKTAEDATNLYKIKYNTNYPISDENGISFVWDNPSESPCFKADWTGKGRQGEITITALTTNETNAVLTDVLHVKLGSITINMIVNQEYVDYKYTLDCATLKVNGAYRPGKTLNATHTITLSLTAEDITVNGANYIIETEPVHGIVFKASGVFNITETNRKVDVTLKGEGTLDANVPIEPFTVQINSNSSSGSCCEATIHPVVYMLNVLTIE